MTKTRMGLVRDQKKEGDSQKSMSRIATVGRLTKIPKMSQPTLGTVAVIGAGK